MNAEAWTAVARVLKAHGVRGEMAAAVETDFPQRFAGLAEVWLCAPGGCRQAFRLQRYRFHRGRVLLTLAGIDDCEQARAWVGAEVQVPRALRAPAPEGHYFLDDLERCRVRDRERELGRVEAVEAQPGRPALLRVRGRKGEEWLIPFAAEYLVGVDLERGEIAMRLPDGLLDINR